MLRFQNKINEPELRKDFEKLCRKMRIKWNFGNDILEKFNEKPVLTAKSRWKPPKGHPSLELFLSQIKKNFQNWLSPCLITLTFPRRNDMP